MIAKALMGVITCQIVGFVVGLLRLNNKKYTNSKIRTLKCRRNKKKKELTKLIKCSKKPLRVV